jgi:peptidoglycan hydrolase-like protein with peptidoglycan-binding domain
MLADGKTPDPTLEAVFEDRARLRAGSPKDAVSKVQAALIDAGYDLGPTGADGIYGGKTATAVKKFKHNEHLGSEEFGDVGPGTMRRLDEKNTPVLVGQ